jgi:peroxiredoxin
MLENKPTEEVTKLLDQAKDTPKERLVRYQLKLGNKEKAVTLANQLPNDAPGLAIRIDALMQCGKVDDAKKQFTTARKTASLLDAALPMSKRLDELAVEFGIGKNWRQPTAARKDSGARPSLDSLGPLHWHPMTSPGFVLSDASGKQVSLKDYAGKPVVVIFYLGSTCSHCMEQLKAFTTAAKDFAAEGIKIVAIGSEPPAELSTTAATCDVKTGAPFTLLSDADLKSFKAWRCYDDFEKTPLHGTFLIDAKGQTRWLDVSFTPFQDAKFLLGEAKRLLKFE